MIAIECAEIWGGIESTDQNIKTKGACASLNSQSYEGNKGGDIYYFSVCGKGLITRIAVADVTGHGERVSEISGWIYKGLSDQMNLPEGNLILKGINNIAFAKGAKGITTASIFTINKGNSTLTFTNAGHPPFFYMKKGENNWREIALEKPTPQGNIPLGIFEDTHFDEETINVEIGDRFFFYTDGLIETINKAGEAFGRKTLLNILNSKGKVELSELKQSVNSAIEKHLDGIPFQDDITQLAVEIVSE